jgi:hypothetical protein
MRAADHPIMLDRVSIDGATYRRVEDSSRTLRV